LNLQPAVLETAALPIEPPPFALYEPASGHAKAWQISTADISVRHAFPGKKALNIREEKTSLKKFSGCCVIADGVHRLFG
jgi:hypothetical protein